uniref:Uncharacterized protein n=1 Tax=Mycena chlorophos TaxID=658473 RepID=A0ABQ0LVH5_MYCCL|nr:predicted protein [Mycena chlorophos]
MKPLWPRRLGLGTAQQIRYIRNRPGRANLREMSEEDQDVLLEDLRAKFEEAKARLEREEAKRPLDSRMIFKKPSEPPKNPAQALNKATSSLWNLLTPEEQKKLARHGIKTLEDLRFAAEEADADLNRPPDKSFHIQGFDARQQLIFFCSSVI